MSLTKAFPEKEVFDTTNNWNETRGFHPDDIILRKSGFTIVSRPKGKEAIWDLAGFQYTTAEAMQVVRDKTTNDPCE